MAVGPVTLNGMIQRTQDVSTLKQQADSKPVVEQQQIQTQIKAQENRMSKQVNHADDTEEKEERYDAKEKGKNEYHGGQQKKKQQKKSDEGSVILKYTGGSFDMKV